MNPSQDPSNILQYIGNPQVDNNLPNPNPQAQANPIDNRKLTNFLIFL